MMQKIDYICDTCGSTNISPEAACLYWNRESQMWVVELAHSGHWCVDCDIEVRITQIDITPVRGVA